MTVHSRITALLALLLLAAVAQAQPGRVILTFEELNEKAEYFMQDRDYYEAVDYYEKAAEKRSDDYNVVYKIAEAYRMGRDYRKAASAYRRIIRRYERDEKRGRNTMDKYDFPLLYYYYAQMLKQQGDYTEAITYYEQFLDRAGEEVDRAYLLRARVDIAGAKLGLARQEPKLKVAEVDNYSKKINSAYTEFAPMPYSESEILFSSLKSDEEIPQAGQEVYARIYKAEFRDNGRVKNAEPLDASFDLGPRHVGHSSITPDGQRMYLTVCDQEDQTAQCLIYMSKKSGSGWTRPEVLGPNINAQGSQSTTPYVTTNDAGDDLLYFSSNRDGGWGGLDLYVAAGRDGVFKAAENLTKLNTPGDEISPFYAPEDVQAGDPAYLYFSSDGQVGYGGFDVFRAPYDDAGVPSTPENVGTDINTPADDMYFVRDDVRRKIYFVSNRAGGYGVFSRTCCDDIFVADLPPPVAFDLVGNVYDGEDSRAVNDATIELFDVTRGRKVLDEIVTQDGQGFKFLNLPLERDYAITLTKEGFESETFEFTTKGVTKSERREKNFYLQQTGLVLNGTTYSDDGSGQPPSILPNAELEILQVNSAGVEVPFATIFSGGAGRYEILLPIGYRYRIRVNATDHLSQSDAVDATNVTGKESRTKDFTLKQKLTDVSFRIANIYYDFDSAKLRPDSDASLQQLLRLLQDNPDAKLEIQSHTDDKGTETYNQQLSQDRAQSVVDWLLERGIERGQLEARGFGESQPIAPNTNPDGSDNPEGRQLNRRTEFRYVGEATFESDR